MNILLYYENDLEWSWLNQILACPIRTEETHENIQAGSCPGRGCKRESPKYRSVPGASHLVCGVGVLDWAKRFEVEPQNFKK